MLNSRRSRQLYVAGVGSGKTHCLVYWALRAAIAQPGVPGALFAPTYRLFLRVVLPTWRLLVPKELYQWRVADQVIRMANGTDILCMGTDRCVERVVGLNLGWAAMDEADATTDDMVPRMIMQRLRVGAPRWRALSMFTSPKGNNRWLKAWSELKTANGQPAVDVVRATTYSNPFLSPEYIADLEIDFPPGTMLHRQELLGEFVSLTGWVYGGLFARDTHCTPVDYDYRQPYDLGWDPGARASGVVAVQEQSPNQPHSVVREWLGDNEFTDDTARRVRREMGDKRPRAIYLDTPSRLNTRTGITDVEALRTVFGGGCDIHVLGGRRRQSDYRHRALSSALSRRRLQFASRLIPRRSSAHERGIVTALETLSWQDDSSRSERVDDKSPLKHVVDALEFYCAAKLPPAYGDSIDRFGVQH
jgi:hypothetical protein